MIEWLEEWTQKQIDGNREHKHVVRLSLVDNPGWFLSVDLINYQEYLVDVFVMKQKNYYDWIDINIKDYHINITGDINKLNKVLITFKTIIEKMEFEDRKLDENTLYEIIKK